MGMRGWKKKKNISPLELEKRKNDDKGQFEKQQHVVVDVVAANWY